MTSNQYACDEAGTRSRLRCVATRGCWYNSKVIQRNTGEQGLLRESMNMQDSFSVLQRHCIRPVLLLLLLLFIFALQSRPPQLFNPLPSLFGLLLLPFMLHLRSPNSLFSLLVFVFASQSRSSRRLQYVFALLTHYFSC